MTQRENGRVTVVEECWEDNRDMPFSIILLSGHLLWATYRHRQSSSRNVIGFYPLSQIEVEYIRSQWFSIILWIYSYIHSTIVCLYHYTYHGLCFGWGSPVTFASYTDADYEGDKDKLSTYSRLPFYAFKALFPGKVDVRSARLSPRLNLRSSLPAKHQMGRCGSLDWWRILGARSLVPCLSNATTKVSYA